MNDVTLDVVSKLVGFSPKYVSANFAEKTGGDNFKLTLKKICIKNACKLLIKTEKSIDEIVGLVGYRDIKTFYEAFKEITGITPYQYQKNTEGHRELPQIVRTAQKRGRYDTILNFQATNWRRYSIGVSFVLSWMRWKL